jgi:hypothetical protein
MNEQQDRALSAGLRALAAATRTASASEGVEAAVLAAMRRDVKPQAPAAAWMPLAAALLLSATSGVWLAQQAPHRRPQPIQPAGFIEVPGVGALPPMESGAIIRVALPVTALPAYGIQIVPEISTDSVEADLLVGQDGVTRAIRLVNDSNTSRSTP